MEEVWKDISLSSLQTPPTNRTTSLPSLTLQDFFSKPLNNSTATTTKKYISKDPTGEVQAAQEVTLLSLSTSGSAFKRPNNYENNGKQLVVGHDCNVGSGHLGSSSSSSSFNELCEGPPLDAFGSGSGSGSGSTSSVSMLGSVCKKRVLQNEDCYHNNNLDDQRHKRMIKNRESAARSRARKQAYTHELEQEVAQLLEENARLKMIQQQLFTASQVPKKPSLQRTSSAPF